MECSHRVFRTSLVHSVNNTVDSLADTGTNIIHQGKLYEINSLAGRTVKNGPASLFCVMMLTSGVQPSTVYFRRVFCARD